MLSPALLPLAPCPDPALSCSWPRPASCRFCLAPPAAPLPCCPALPCPASRVLVLSLLCLPCCATRPCHTLQTSPAFATTPSPAPRPPLPCPVCRRFVLSLFASPFSLPCLMILCNPAFTIQLLFYHLLEGFGCWVWGFWFGF